MTMRLDSFHTFQYNGHRLSEFGAVIAQRPKITTAMRDISFNEIPFHSGDVVQDNGRYKNITLKIKIRALPNFCSENFQSWCYSIIEWLNSATDYVVYRDTYNPGYFRLGIVTNISDFVAVRKNVYEAEVKITCKPFLYRDSGLTTISFTMASTENSLEKSLFNPEKVDSEPVIVIEGTGELYIVFGDALMTVDVTTKMIIDKPNEAVTDASGVSCNDKISSVRLPSLTAGQNSIHISRTSGTGDITMTITPNWRRL